jgi:hypothetical protein
MRRAFARLSTTKGSRMYYKIETPKPAGFNKRSRREYLRAVAEERKAQEKLQRDRRRKQKSRVDKTAGTLIHQAKNQGIEKLAAQIWPEKKPTESKRHRFDELYEALSLACPKLLHRDYGLQLRRFVEHDWIRSPGTWKPHGRGTTTLLISLAEHLFQEYPVPRFVMNGFLFDHGAVITVVRLIQFSSCLLTARASETRSVTV